MSSEDAHYYSDGEDEDNLFESSESEDDGSESEGNEDKEKKEDEDEEENEEANIEEEAFEELSPIIEEAFNETGADYIEPLEVSGIINSLAEDIENGHEFTEEQEEFLDVYNESRPEYIAQKWFYNRDKVPFEKEFIRHIKGRKVKMNTKNLRIIQH